MKSSRKTLVKHCYWQHILFRNKNCLHGNVSQQIFSSFPSRLWRRLRKINQNKNCVTKVREPHMKRHISHSWREELSATLALILMSINDAMLKFSDWLFTFRLRCTFSLLIKRFYVWKSAEWSLYA